ncbi:MAG TPA: acyl-CoA dehydrogenase family protein [Acidimicrobiia bacterium]|nr:acyl-CoA dehydrogenase family protein [Acidimicrobiia bacterium]
MDFEFSEDQELLRDSVRRFLADRAPIASYVRPLLDGDADRTPEVWDGLAALGVVGLLVPEEHGGAGMGMVDAAVVLEELGRAVHPGPYLATAVGAVTLSLAAGASREHSFLLPAMASGSVVGTVALLEPGRRFDVASPHTSARRVGEGWVVEGEKVHVPDAVGSDVVLVSATVADDDTVGVFAVQTSAGGIEITATPTVDGTRKQATVALDGAPGWRLGSTDASAAVARTVDRMAVATVIDGVGAAARALELAVEYAKERIAFDHPIGSFQAVQHLCADMLRAVELGRAAGYYACWAADDAPPEEAHRAATMAKAFASEAFPQVGGSAIQVFGGIGFTWEHDVHLYYKRLLSLAYTLGAADDALEELAALALSPRS